MTRADLAKDPHEKTDLSAKEPARVEALKVLLTKLAAADTTPRSAAIP